MPSNFDVAWGAIQPIRGWFSNKEQARRMWNALQDGGHAIEIGSYCGRSTVFLALAVMAAGKGGLVYAVDTFESSNSELDGSGTLGEFEVNLEFFGVADHVVTLQGRSGDPKIVEAVPNGAALLYIDANHDYEFVFTDISIWRKHVRKGGLLMMHDYYTDGSEQFPGVKQAADDAFGAKLLHNREIIRGDSVCFTRPQCSCKGW